ncbi:HlyC/CorC family transporter [Deinococcus sp. SDU3-2]|uniref:HlyC/CorC family transporter n=1 Tax=Deinococcus terrestris TaxID=2651870 RepID=A0A7X1TQM1_9DEIO|nr:hemolysin family protein [Deinococcus terrestris]MPY65424.1 HlyC/CorC family transporter [Deinococcus terrestris]
MGNPWLEFGILVLLLIVNGLFSGSELGVVSARKSRLQARATAGHRGAARALALAERPGAFLATVQIGITLIGTISAVFAGGSLTQYLEPALRPLFGESAGSAASVAVVLLVTFLSLVLGELAPKNIALRDPEGLAARVAPFFTVLSRVMRPVVWLLEGTTRGLLWLLGLRGEPQEKITEEDVKALALQAAESGSLEAGETERIDHVLRFNDRRVRDLMTHRADVVLLSAAAPVSESIEQVLAAPHDRYPLTTASGEVIGQVRVVDVLRASRTGESLTDLMQPVLFVPETAWAEDALSRLTEGGHQRLAIVVDEYGLFSGLLTATDLLTELAGVDAPGEEEMIVRREDGSFLVDGGVPMHDLRATLPLPRQDPEEFSTLAGYVLEALGEFPQVGARTQVGGWTLEVVDLDGPRIDQVLIVPPPDVILVTPRSAGEG